MLEQVADTVYETETKVNDEPKKIDEKLVAVLKEKEPKPAKPSEELLTQSRAGAGGSQSSRPPTQKIAETIVTKSDTLRSSELESTTQPTAVTLAEQDDFTTEEVIITAPVAESTPQPKALRMEESKRSKAKTATVPSLVISGVVRDQRGQPIPGVNIVSKGSTTGTITNGEGKYSIEVPSADQTLVYSFIGYEAQERPLSKLKDGSLDVKMEEDVTQLSEVVVTGYGDKRDSMEPVVRLAEPEGGRKAYDQYLDEKKIYPRQAIENKVEGRVTIEFTVGITGVLSDFEVTKKLGYGCDEEVIRLVKEGPQWKPSYIDNEAVESLVKIKTKFKLPGK
jgi:TonB family protein